MIAYLIKSSSQKDILWETRTFKGADDIATIYSAAELSWWDISITNLPANLETKAFYCWKQDLHLKLLYSLTEYNEWRKWVKTFGLFIFILFQTWSFSWNSEE